MLRILQQHGQAALPLFADFAIARLPLSEDEWALLPSHCPGLGRALPAALAHSATQASRLVRRLPPGNAERLRTFALCLARVQRRSGIQLPVAIVDVLLSQSIDAPISMPSFRRQRLPFMWLRRMAGRLCVCFSSGIPGNAL